MHLSINKSYGGRIVFHEAQIDLPENGMIALLGENGAGKSTLLSCIFDGVGSGCVAFLPQNETPLWDCLASEYILMGRYSAKRTCLSFYTNEDRAAVAEVAAFLSIGELLGRNILELSGGERQKCAIARALVAKKKITLLDEPLSALDFLYAKTFLVKLQTLSAGALFVVAIHDVNVALRYFSDFALLTGGKILLGDAATIITQENIDSAYGKGLCVAKRDGVLFVE